MKKTFISIFCFFGCIQTCNAMCLKFAYDINAKLISAQCGAQDPRFNCKMENKTAWNGKECIKPEIIKRCESKKGIWDHVQFYGGENGFLEVCKCPDNLVWNGINCIKTANESFIKSLNNPGSENVKITKELWKNGR